MENIELQQIVCPSCRQLISSFTPYSTKEECPYCHNQIFNPTIEIKKISKPSRIIPFKTTRDDFQRVIIKAIVERDYVPVDVFQCLSPDKLMKIYLPMFLFEGTYQASYSCRMDINLLGWKDSESYAYVSRSGYMPHSGTAQGNFTILSLAHLGEDIPQELRSFCKQQTYQAIVSKEYDSSVLEQGDLDKALIFSPDIDAQAAWSKEGENRVKQLSEDNTKNQLVQEHIKDFRSSMSYALSNIGSYILVPFWFASYTYNNERCYFIMDGLGENATMSIPIDQQELKAIKKIKRKRVLSYLLVFPVFIFLIYSRFFDALAYLLLWAIFKIIFNFILNRKIKNRLKYSQEIRRQFAEKFQFSN